MFIIPMVGLSSRFFKAGYDKPKYMLKAGDKTLFSLSLESFKTYFETDFFLFIVRPEYETSSFVKNEANLLGIKNYSIVILEKDTRGQAETVALGLQKTSFNDEPIYIFNIDTFRPNFCKPQFSIKTHGYLETFIGSGKNWSNVVPIEINSDKVLYTAEKKEISKFCCTGLYFWKSAELYMNIYEDYKKLSTKQLDGGEYYIAPMYNLAIKNGEDIRYTIIPTDDVIFCGTPNEYINYISKLNRK